MAIYYMSLIGAILFGVVGQIALKSGAVGSQISLVVQFANPWTIVGLLIYLLGALCYTLALRKIPVSVAFPSIASSYAIVALIAHLLWNEPLGWPQICGFVLIGSGILLVNLSNDNTLKSNRNI